MPAFLTALNPGWLLILAGVVAIFLPMRRARQGIAIAAPLIGIALLAMADQNVNHLTASVMGMDLVLYRVDGLSFVFGLLNS